MDLLKGLNKEQQLAVKHTDGPLLVLAGAGSGKTSVLTRRIAYIIENKGVYPSNLLAITFTNKAAREMRERVENIIGDSANGMWISTFHSCCVRILRRYIDRLDYDTNFVIFDPSDQQTLIKDCIKQLNLNEKNHPPKQVLHTIGRAKDELTDAESFLKINEFDFRLSQIAKIYELYQKRLKQNNALDFDDIIMLTIKLLSENTDVLEYYQNKFKYIMVDEYQDTNTAQYFLITLLAGGHKNLCVVGDSDQSIYEWRGANIRNILDFEKEFPQAVLIKLEQNYRSTKNILNAANSVIQNNIERKEKALWTNNDKGEQLVWYEAENEHDEARFISGIIDSMSKGDKNFKDFAVLYRMNAQSRVIEDSFMKKGIPYKIVGGHKFYDRKEIKDIIAYLRVLQNPHDNISLKRIINVPRRGIGKTTVEKLEILAYEQDVSMYAVLRRAEELPELKTASGKLERFTTLIGKLAAFKDVKALPEFVEMVIDQSGLKKELEQEDSVEARTRIENIEEFLSVVIEFINREAPVQSLNEEDDAYIEEKTLEGFLAHISLVADIDEVDSEGNNVMLMTLHSAKGLEFPIVFMTGMEEGVFPGFRSMESEQELEESRRLCYVGITRAKEKLFITSAQARMIFGKTNYQRPSRFIREIPEELISGYGNRYTATRNSQTRDNEESLPFSSSAISSSGSTNTSFNKMTNIEVGERGKVKKYADAFRNNALNDSTNNVIQFNRLLNREDKLESNTTGQAIASSAQFNVGDKIIHKKFGKGVIVARKPDANDYLLEIVFETGGIKRLAEGFVGAAMKKL